LQARTNPNPNHTNPSSYPLAWPGFSIWAGLGTILGQAVFKTVPRAALSYYKSSYIC